MSVTQIHPPPGHTPTHTDTHTHTHIPTPTHTHTHTHTHPHAHTHTRTRTHTRTHPRTHACTHAATHACTHAPTHAHTHTHISSTSHTVEFLQYHAHHCHWWTSPRGIRHMHLHTHVGNRGFGVIQIHPCALTCARAHTHTQPCRQTSTGEYPQPIPQCRAKPYVPRQ